MPTCIFCKIARKEIPKDFVYEDSEVMVFADIHPIKPIHLLIVPKKHIDDHQSVLYPELFGKLYSVVQKMVKKEKLEDKGYRIVVNGGGAQIVNHLHIHLFGPLGKAVAM